MNYGKKFFVIFILCISSCSILPPAKTGSTNNYALNTVPAIKARPTHAATLLIMPGVAASAYGTKQIAYSTSPYQLAYFAKHYWIIEPAKMLQQLLVQTLQNSHYYHAIISSPDVGHFDYILHTQLLELKQDYTYNPSVIRLVVRAQLTRTSDNKIIRAKQFAAVAVTAANTPCAGVVAANHAAAEIVAEIAEFSIRNS